MGNRKRYAKFQENLFSSNKIKSIFCPPLFRKTYKVDVCYSGDNIAYGWLVGCFGLNGPLRQYFNLYRAVSQR